MFATKEVPWIHMNFRRWVVLTVFSLWQKSRSSHTDPFQNLVGLLGIITLDFTIVMDNCYHILFTTAEHHQCKTIFIWKMKSPLLMVLEPFFPTALYWCWFSTFLPFVRITISFKKQLQMMTSVIYIHVLNY